MHKRFPCIQTVRPNQTGTSTTCRSRWLQGFVPLSALEKQRQPTVAEVEKPAIETVVTEPKCRYIIDVFSDQFSEIEIRDSESLNESGKIDHYFNRFYQIAANENLYENNETDWIDTRRARDIGLVWEMCWQQLTNKPSCHVFRGVLDETYGPDYTIVFLSDIDRAPLIFEWSGACENGVVQGMGTITGQYVNWLQGSYTATFVDGKREETYREETYDFDPGIDGCVIEGRYEKGLRTGKWVTHSCPEWDKHRNGYFVYDEDGKLVECLGRHHEPVCHTLERIAQSHESSY